MKIILLLFGELLSLCLIALAQDITDKNFDINNGLSNNSIRTILQDSKGFMWFGTYNGLNRFDGYDFKVFINNIDDSLSLPHN